MLHYWVVVHRCVKIRTAIYLWVPWCDHCKVLSTLYIPGDCLTTMTLFSRSFKIRWGNPIPPISREACVSTRHQSFLGRIRGTNKPLAPLSHFCHPCPRDLEHASQVVECRYLLSYTYLHWSPTVIPTKRIPILPQHAGVVGYISLGLASRPTCLLLLLLSSVFIPSRLSLPSRQSRRPLPGTSLLSRRSLPHNCHHVRVGQQGKGCRRRFARRSAASICRQPHG